MKKILTLSDFPPCEGLAFAQSDWLVAPVSQTYYSDPLTRANFDALWDELDECDPNGKDSELIRWPHFKTKWVECIFVRPGSKCANIAFRARESLAEYPILDEDLWVEYEAENEKD